MSRTSRCDCRLMTALLPCLRLGSSAVGFRMMEQEGCDYKKAAYCPDELRSLGHMYSPVQVRVGRDETVLPAAENCTLSIVQSVRRLQAPFGGAAARQMARVSHRHHALFHWGRSEARYTEGQGAKEPAGSTTRKPRSQLLYAGRLPMRKAVRRRASDMSNDPPRSARRSPESGP